MSRTTFIDLISRVPAHDMHLFTASTNVEYPIPIQFFHAFELSYGHKLRICERRDRDGPVGPNPMSLGGLSAEKIKKNGNLIFPFFLC